MSSAVADAARLAERPGIRMHQIKTRKGDRSVEINFVNLSRFKNRPALLVDDIVSSEGTLVVCAHALKAACARAIDAVITNALFSPELVQEFQRVDLRSMRSATSVPHPINAIALDTILADALRDEMDAK